MQLRLSTAAVSYRVEKLLYLSAVFGRSSSQLCFKSTGKVEHKQKVRASMRATAYLQGAGACGPPVLPTRLRRFGRTFDPLEGLCPSHGRYAPAAPTPKERFAKSRA